MLSTIRKVAMATFAIALCAAPAMAGDQDFTLHNNTSKTLNSLYVSPHSDDKRGDDILGEDTLGAGQTVDIKFAHDEDHCHWDVKGDFEGGGSAEVDDVDLCTVSDVNFHD